MTEEQIKQKAEEYVNDKADKGNYDYAVGQYIFFGKSTLENAYIKGATETTKELQEQIEDLKKQIREMRHQEVVDMYSRYPC